MLAPERSHSDLMYLVAQESQPFPPASFVEAQSYTNKLKGQLLAGLCSEKKLKGVQCSELVKSREPTRLFL